MMTYDLLVPGSLKVGRLMVVQLYLSCKLSVFHVS